MNTIDGIDDAETAVRRQAMTFYRETVENGRPLEPTDENLSGILTACAQVPQPNSFDQIRSVLAEEYEVTLTQGNRASRTAIMIVHPEGDGFGFDESGYVRVSQHRGRGR